MGDVDRKETVRRFVEEAVNGGRDGLVADLFTPAMAAFAREWFGGFRRSFPDMGIAGLWGIEDTLDRFHQLGLDPPR